MSMSNLTSSSPGYDTLTPPPLPSAYTPAQILSYLEHISFPLPLTFPRDATSLLLLHRLQITTIPYENLSLHYSPTHSNSLDPQTLFDKFVPPPDPTTSRGRGGYCFETAVFWLNILRGLGFRAYSSQARIRLRDGPVPRGDFVGPRHVVTVVDLGDEGRWSTDVGFGGNGPTRPLRLDETTEEDGAVMNLGSQEVRVVRGVFPGTADRARNPVWFYEYRNGKGQDWNRYYAFGDNEASLWELECANWWVATHPDSFQRKQVLVVKFLGEEKAGGRVEVTGKVMLADGVVKRNMGGKTEVLRVLETEEDRVKALNEIFGIGLTVDELTGIDGFPTALKT